jgi:hypothetical protein
MGFLKPHVASGGGVWDLCATIVSAISEASSVLPVWIFSVCFKLLLEFEFLGVCKHKWYLGVLVISEKKVCVC